MLKAPRPGFPPVICLAAFWGLFVLWKPHKMYCVNSFGRTVEVDDTEGEYFVKRGELRKATAEEIDQYQAQRAAMNARAAAEKDSSIYFQTVKSSPDGYGMSRDHLIQEVSKLGVQLVENFNDQKVGLLYNYPYGITSMRTTIRIIYTMFESDKLPAEWADYLDMADEVLVPSKFCQDTFAKAGIKSTVVPLGYNDKIFRFIERGDPADRGRPYTFIHYDSYNLRKGWSEVFQAFNEEFGPDDNVRLILKTAQEAVALPIMPSQYPNIETITGSLPEAELLALLGRSDCMVYPSRGEGFGITPLEAMATGLPAIIPNEHGISEYFNRNFMIEVKAPGRCPGLYSRFKGEDVGEMVVADVADLRAKMRWAFEHQDEADQLGRDAAEYVQKYTYAETAKALAAILKKWQSADVIKRTDGKYLQVERV